MNATVTSDLNSVRKMNGQVSKPGEIRDFSIGRELRRGLKINGLPQRIDKMAQELFDLLQMAERDAIDPVEAAARAYLIHDAVKPFFDGNGRTALALSYFFLERLKMPLP